MGNGRRGRQALATPAGDVRHQYVGTKMQLRLVEDQPTARPIAAAMKGPNELTFKDGRRVHVGYCRTRKRVQLTLENLRNKVLWNGAEIRVRRTLLEWLGHASRLTWPHKSRSSTNPGGRRSYSKNFASSGR